MRIIEAVERTPFSLPIREVLDQSGDLTIIQKIKNTGYFNIELRSNELTLVAGNYIGQIPLTNDISINVSPKVPINNLARVISLGNQPIKCLDFFQRRYQVKGKASHSLQEAIAASVVNSLKVLDSEGIYREYLKKEETLIGLRGKINIPSYVRSQGVKPNPFRVPCVYYELSADTLLNQVIKKAIYKIGFVLSSQTSDKGLLEDLNYFANRFGSVKLDQSSSLERRARDYLLHHRVPVLRQYYLELIDVCLIILEGSGVEIRRTSTANKMFSFIVNLESAFEGYVRAVLRRSSTINSHSNQVFDGNNEARSTLFFDNSKFDAKPDIVIGPLGSVLALGDVKYKTKLSEADRYQLIAHALSYNTNKAFFVTPLNDKSESVESYIGKIGTIEVHHYKMDLDALDIDEMEASFQRWVFNLLKPYF